MLSTAQDPRKIVGRRSGPAILRDVPDAGGDDLGPWNPLTVEETFHLLSAAPFRWWVTGGHALELHLTSSWRDHGDLDIGICRHDAGLLHRWLADWDVHVAAAGRLRPWHGEPLEAQRNENNLWCRRSGTDDWRLDVVVGAGTDERWIYRRDERITRRWSEAVLRTPAGIPYLAPELQLLFKSRNPREKDHVDAQHVIPRLEPGRREALVAVLPPAHPWQELLAGPAGGLKTERLALRPISVADVDLLVALDADPQVMRYINGGRLSSRDEVLDIVRRSLGHRWLAFARGSRDFLGWFALRPTNPDGSERELGYRLRRGAWGQGYATEGSRALVALAFTRFGARRVWAQTMTVNRASRRVLERCGLRHVRTFHLDWPEPIDGSDQGDVEYELRKEHWPPPDP